MSTQLNLARTLNSSKKLLTNKKELARVLISPYTLLTSSLRSMPDFIIIGAAKCGTSSLYKYLTQHPKIKSAFQKEPSFFNTYFDKGLTWYRSNFPIQRQNFITGEASPGYFYYPPAPQRIAKLIPAVKLIVLLRNPVDRACSLYYYNLKHLGDKDEFPFEEAIRKEPQRLNSEFKKIIDNENYYDQKDYYYLHKKYYHFAYLRTCIYQEHLNHWLQFFPKQQLLILKSEDLFEKPKKLMHEY
ncbi:MAG: sulfotransferase domain-containing protein [Pleurocapsa sp.]